MKVVNESLMLLVRDVKKQRIIVRYNSGSSKATLHQSKYVLLKAERKLNPRQQLKLEAIEKLHLA